MSRGGAATDETSEHVAFLPCRRADSQPHACTVCIIVCVYVPAGSVYQQGIVAAECSHDEHFLLASSLTPSPRGLTAV